MKEKFWKDNGVSHMIQEKVQQPGQRNKAVLGQKQLFIVSDFCGLLQI